MSAKLPSPILKEKRTPMCMIYGKEDPWVVPFWGQRAKQQNPDAVYYELSPAGHCPHHEAPEVVNTLVRKWVESVQSQGALSPALLDAGVNHKQLHWFVVEIEGKRVAVLVKGTQGFWSNLMDSFREVFGDLAHESPHNLPCSTEETSQYSYPIGILTHSRGCWEGLLKNVMYIATHEMNKFRR